MEGPKPRRAGDDQPDDEPTEMSALDVAALPLPPPRPTPGVDSAAFQSDSSAATADQAPADRESAAPTTDREPARVDTGATTTDRPPDDRESLPPASPSGPPPRGPRLADGADARGALSRGVGPRAVREHRPGRPRRRRARPPRRQGAASHAPRDARVESRVGGPHRPAAVRPALEVARGDGRAQSAAAPTRGRGRRGAVLARQPPALPAAAAPEHREQVDEEDIEEAVDAPEAGAGPSANPESLRERKLVERSIRVTRGAARQSAAHALPGPPASPLQGARLRGAAARQGPRQEDRLLQGGPAGLRQVEPPVRVPRQGPGPRAANLRRPVPRVATAPAGDQAAAGQPPHPDGSALGHEPGLRPAAPAPHEAVRGLLVDPRRVSAQHPDEAADGDRDAREHDRGNPVRGHPHRLRPRATAPRAEPCVELFLALSREAEPRLQAMPLQAADRLVVASINGGRTVRGILARATTGPGSAAQLVYALLCAELVETRTQPAAAAPPADPVPAP